MGQNGTSIKNSHICFLMKQPKQFSGKKWDLGNKNSRAPGNWWALLFWSISKVGREDPLEKEMPTHSSILAWKIPWMEDPGRLQSMGSQRVGHDWATSLLHFKAIDCVGHNKLWKTVKETGIPDHLTWLLRNLYAGQEATVRIGHGTMNWFKIGNGVPQGSLLIVTLLI